MAEFQWWLLLVGLVAGGGLVAVVFLDGARREGDIEEAELPAEAHWIAARLSHRDSGPDPRLVEAVLREHREYRLLPPPDRLEPLDAPASSSPMPPTAAAIHEASRVEAANAPRPSAPATGATDANRGR